MSVLVSCLYNLATNPDKQEILRKEAFRILPERNSRLTNDSLNKIQYTRASLKESLRLNAVTTGHSRSAGQDLVLKGYQIPKGTIIAYPSVAITESEQYFTRPTEFIPERWIRGADIEVQDKKMSNPFIFLPFGFGPRSCIGRRFAEMENFATILRILREFKIEYHYGPIEYKNGFVFIPQDDLKFKFIDLNE